MERLQRRSDGFYETASGLFAVSPKRHIYESASYLQFNFKARPLEPSIIVRWRKEDGIAVIDASVAQVMYSSGYATHASEEQVARWNEKADELASDAQEPEGNEGSDTDPPKAIEEPVKEEPAAEEAAKEQTEPEQASGDDKEGEKSNGAEDAAKDGSSTEEAPAEQVAEQNADAAEGEKPDSKKKKGSVI